MREMNPIIYNEDEDDDIIDAEHNPNVEVTEDYDND
jgi:hypothetical protein